MEMLTASVIGGFVAMVAAGALNAISTGRDKLDDHVAAASELRYVESLIRRDLSNMYRDSDNTKRLLIGTVNEDGDRLNSKIIFYTTRWSPVRVGGVEGDVCEVEYGLVEDEGEMVFYRRSWPNPDRLREPKGVLRRVSDRVRSFGVRYHDGTEWRFDWPENKRELPLMIEVGLAVESGEGVVLESQFMMNFSRWPQGRERGGGRNGGNGGGGGRGNGDGNGNR